MDTLIHVSSLHAYEVGWLMRSTTSGIALLVDTNAAHDIMGPCCGSIWKEAGLGDFFRWNVHCHSTVRFQQDDMADDPIQVSWWHFRWVYRVRRLPPRFVIMT